MARTIDWAALVRKAEGPKPTREPAYVFGNRIKYEPANRPGRPYRNGGNSPRSLGGRKH